MRIAELRYNLIKDIQDKVLYKNNMVGHYAEEAVRKKGDAIRLAENEIAQADARKELRNEIISLIWKNIPDSLNNIDIG